MIGALASEFECIVPNLPGFGGSRSLGGLPCLDSYAATITALAPARPWIAVGHSMGGKIVLAAALLQPDKLAGLILIAPSPPTPEPMTDNVRSKTIAAFGDRVAARAHFAAITDHTLTPALFDVCVEDEVSVDRTAWDWWLKSGSRDDISRATSFLELPVLVVTGDNDKVLGSETARNVAADLPGSRLEIVAGAGHLLPLERPDAIAALMLGLGADFAGAA